MNSLLFFFSFISIFFRIDLYTSYLEHDKRRDMFTLFLREFKLGRNVSHTASNHKITWDEVSTCDQTVRCWIRKLLSEFTNLGDKEYWQRPSAIINQHLKKTSRTVITSNSQINVSDNRSQYLNNIWQLQEYWQYDQ